MGELVRLNMTDAQLTAAVRAEGLTGARALMRALDETHERAVVIHSVDYRPLERGWMVARRGRDQADAFALALEAAKEAARVAA